MILQKGYEKSINILKFNIRVYILTFWWNQDGLFEYILNIFVVAKWITDI